ncbi:MAG: acyltransferase family protein [Prevotella sp.]|nr:acyltransferase family protein [Candidatus Prevotella equi]
MIEFDSLKHRLPIYDIAKGLGMIFVIIGHICSLKQDSIALFIEGLCNLFHLPLFFFIAGIFLREDSNIVLYIEKRSKSLMKPYYIYGVICFLIVFVVQRDFILERFMQYLLGERMTFTGALWFLPVMFSSSIIGSCIIKLRLNYQIGLIAIFLLICDILFRNKIMLPLNLDASMYFVPFLILGHYWGGHNQRHNYNLLVLSVCLLIILGIRCYYAKYNIICNLYLSEIGILPLTFVASLCGIYSCFYLSHYIQRSCERKGKLGYKVLHFIGVNSLLILIIHQKFCIHIIQNVISFEFNYILLFILFIFTVIFSCIGAVVIKKYLNFTI